MTRCNPQYFDVLVDKCHVSKTHLHIERSKHLACLRILSSNWKLRLLDTDNAGKLLEKTAAKYYYSWTHLEASDIKEWPQKT